MRKLGTIYRPDLKSIPYFKLFKHYDLPTLSDMYA